MDKTFTPTKEGAMTTDDRLLILNESDTKGCLHGCGCTEALPADFHVNPAWYAEIEEGEAVVLCPSCFGGLCENGAASDTKEG